MSDDMHCYRDDHAVYREVQHERLRLIQVAAVTAAWVEAIDRRST